MIRTSGATPPAPVAASRAAATSPATKVPWPWIGVPCSGPGSQSRKSHPWTSSTNPFPSSSSWLAGISPGLRHSRSASPGRRWIPESITATTISPQPRVICQAWGARMAARPQRTPPDWHTYPAAPPTGTSPGKVGARTKMEAIATQKALPMANRRLVMPQSALV